MTPPQTPGDHTGGGSGGSGGGVFEAASESGNWAIGVDSDQYNTADPAKGKTAAQGMFDNGADIVYHAAGGSGAGLFEAAKSHSEDSGSKVWAIGVDSDQYLTSDESVRDYILSSMLKRVDVAVFNTIHALGEDAFQGGGVMFDLAVDGVGYATTGGFVDDIAGELDDLKAKVVNSSISVPEVPGERAVVLPDLGGRVVTIAVDNAYLPFAYIPADTGVATGWDYDAMDEVCARLNCVPSFQEFAWDGTIIATGEGPAQWIGLQRLGEQVHLVGVLALVALAGHVVHDHGAHVARDQGLHSEGERLEGHDSILAGDRGREVVVGGAGHRTCAAVRGCEVVTGADLRAALGHEDLLIGADEADREVHDLVAFLGDGDATTGHVELALAGSDDRSRPGRRRSPSAPSWRPGRCRPATPRTAASPGRGT